MYSAVLTVVSLLEPIIERVIREGYRSLKSWWKLNDRMPEVSRAFNKVRNELWEVGLLADDFCLDQIELKVALLLVARRSRLCIRKSLLYYETPWF